MDRILRYQNICSKYNRFCAKNNTFLYLRTEMELRNKEEEMKYFSNFIFKAVFYTEKRLARRLPSVARSVPCLQGD